MDIIKNDLINDILTTRCADPFGCLGLQQGPAKKGLSLTVWQPEALSIRVLAMDSDTLLSTMKPTQHPGLFYAEWPKEHSRFHYRLEITYKDNSQYIIVDPYQFPEATFTDPEHHQADRKSVV